MDVDTISNFVHNLGHIDFKKVAHLILTKVFYLQVVNVDGKGDGGTDWCIFKDKGGSESIAIQDTTQKKGWEKKRLKMLMKRLISME